MVRLVLAEDIRISEVTAFNVGDEWYKLMADFVYTCFTFFSKDFVVVFNWKEVVYIAGQLDLALLD